MKCSVRIPEHIQKFEKSSKIHKSFWTQKVYQDILKTQRLIGQEKNETRANGHRKTQKATKKMGLFPSGVANFVIG
jgi:hypothetical protein